MSDTQLPRGPERLQRPGAERLTTATGVSRRRKLPTPGRIARRRVAVGLTKWLLPVLAILLLASIALWPELDRMSEKGRVAFRRAFNVEQDSARMREPRYRGVDERGRPYMFTADSALQAGPQRVEMAEPRGDLVTESGNWLMVQSRDGVYMQHLGQLDLAQDVVLYRDDGTIMRSQTATLNTKQGAVASSDQTHAEGPFGVLDSQGFILVDKGAAIQFYGPARLITNGANR